MNILKKYYTVIIPLLVFIIYIVTLAPTVIQIDSGELAAVQATLGIAHPTGYPLFTITGYLFSLLPLPFTTIYQLNVLAAIWCAGGIFFFILTAKLLLINTNQFNKEKIKAEKKSSKKIKKQKEVLSENNEEEIPQAKIITGIIAGSLILAFSKTFWFQSTSVEVYSLHIFLILLIIFSLINAYLKKDNDLKSWLTFSVVLALGFTNHMTTLLILPGAAYLFFAKHKFNKAALKKISAMLLIFFPVLILFYSYLPIRASQDPVINWGNPLDFEKLIRHISGKQYQVWLFSSAEAAKKQLEYFFNTIFSEFSISLFICFAGIISSYIIARKAFIFLIITFASTILYSINYDIVDIDSYFLLAYISLSFFSIFGAVKLLSLLKFKASSSSKNYTYAISTALIGLFIAVQIYINFSKADNSNTYIFEDYTKALINSTEENSLIISYQWDYFISASYYFQFVENFRRDAAIVDKELLRRSWYFKQLETAYPDLLAGIKTEQKLFLNALQPFERDENFNSNLLENLYQNLMTNLISTNISHREVYIAPELFENEMQKELFRLPEGFTIIPDLFLFKVVKGNDYVPAANPDFKLRFPEKRNYYINMIENFSGSMLIRRAMYELQFDKVEKAKIYIQKAKDELPGYKIPPGLETILKK